MKTEKQTERQQADTQKMPVLLPKQPQDEQTVAMLVGAPRATVDEQHRPIHDHEPQTIMSGEPPESHLDGNHCATEPSISRHAVMPGVSDEAEAQINESQENGSLWRRVLSGLSRFLKKIAGRDRNLPKVDPLNGNAHCFTKVEYVSRWALVEFGVTCPKCEALAAAPGQFKRIWNTADGEAVTCPECKSTLLASPTTEKDEHLLPYSPKLHNFSRKRHQWSPYTTQQAAEIRESLASRLKKDPFEAVKREQALAQEKSA